MKFSRRIVIPAILDDKDIWAKALKYQIIYSVFGLILGLSTILLGVYLFIIGATGSASWSGQFAGASFKLVDAGPGVVLFVVGLWVVYLTRFTIEVKK